MADIPCGLWLSSGLALTACCSAIVLSIQRGLHHKTSEEEHHATPIKLDRQRDLTVQFADTDRFARVTFSTTILVTLAIYNVCQSYRSLNETRSQEGVYAVVASAFSLTFWLYSLAVVLISRRHRLPSDWGWILNVHLCLLYFVAWCSSVQSVWTALTEQVSYKEGMQTLLVFILNSDLFYTTATIERGAPFLDENGKQVVGVNVSSVYSFLFFSWVNPLVKTASRKKQISDEDLPTLPPLYRGYNVYYIFGEFRELSLLRRIYRTNRTAIIVQIITAIASSLVYYMPAYFVNQLLYLIQDIGAGKGDESSMKRGLLIVSGLGLSIFTIGIIVGQLWYFAASSVQVRIKAMLNIEIYRKTLRRIDQSVSAGDKEDASETNADKDKDAKDDDSQEDVTSSTGTIVNLMSTDSNRISEFSTWWFSILAAPIELTVGTYFLYSLLGWSCFLGLLVMVVTLPLNHYNAKLFAKTQDELMESRDKRVSLMNEVLQGIRQIKFFAWETNWEKRVMAARNIEMRHLRTTFISEALFTLLWQGSPLLVTIVSFWSFTKLDGKELTAPIAFTAIAVFNELRFALNILPEVFIEWLQALISLRRIQAYLSENEIAPAPEVDPNERSQITFKNATIGWKAPMTTTTEPGTPDQASQASSDTTVDTDNFTLKDLDVEFPQGTLSLICGATGSGKTLMMLSLLGEAVVLKGDVVCPRTAVTDTVSGDFTLTSDIPAEDWILERALAYVSQSPWLQNASIRDNILFGLPFVEQRYNETLYVCALDKDLSILDDGDMTEIGEKGITLSGGQKARVALARAVYSRAKNVLMDDVLSAVDAHTAKHLYDKCLMGSLMKDRTQILVTHHVGLCLNGSACVVHIKNGRADLVDSPAGLRQSGKLVEILKEEKASEEPVAEEEEVSSSAAATLADPSLPVSNSAEAAVKKSPKTLVEDETRATGMVKLRLYKLYSKNVGGVVYWLFLFALIIGSRGLEITESWWVKQWAQSYKPEANGTMAVFGIHSASQQQSSFSYLNFAMAPSAVLDYFATKINNAPLSVASDKTESVNYYLGIYIMITMTNIVIGTARFAVVYWGSLGASRKLYGELLHRVFRAPLRFFDKTPVGRILNRFSKDFETIDSKIPNDFLNLTIEWIIVFSSVIAVSLVLPIFILPLIVVATMTLALGSNFVSTSRELKRIDSVSRSPLFSHFTETIVGVTTIRAFGATRQFLQEMLKRVDANSRPFYYVWVVNRWISVRYSLLGAVINFSMGLIVLLSVDKIDAALAGFCLSFVLVYTDQMFWAIRRYTNLEMSFNAVERVVEFMEMEQEAPAITDMRPPPEWPTHGRIDVRDLEVRYAPDLDPVLRGVSFSVNAKEKIGIVGRTGSGKSTLSLSFFRFVEASAGSIVIDDVDIKHLGTEDLRSNLTIIPQDPTLFSGTLRSNMDPFDQFSDDAIFAALRHVHLLPSDDDEFAVQEGDTNANVFKDLDTNVSEGGKNFSQGQRQLLCLARALLKRSRIVLMDEATASVDFNTDKAIQKTIATEFAHCTILCIAHRLHTVIEYDRILVLDHGRVVEFASPLQLITDTDSAFHKMCRNSGEYESLMKLAKARHQLVDV